MHRHIKSAIAGLLAAALLSIGALAAPLATPQQGIDVSHYDEAVDWAAVKASGRSWAYIKATEGETWSDSYFASNRQGAATAGVLWGPYHFFRAYSIASARLQAEHFWQAIAGTGYTLRPVVDMETADGQQRAVDVRAILQAFCDRFAELSGTQPVIYSYTSCINEYGLAGQFGDRLLWQADYRSVRADTGWTAQAWQYSDKGSVPGVTALQVDLNAMLDDGLLMPGVTLPSTDAPTPRAQAALTTNMAGDPRVLSLQRRLNRLGIPRPPLTEDGVTGPKTRAAVRVLEQVAGITVDGGTFGRQCDAAASTIEARPTLRYGSRGVAVRWLQYRLGIAIDGVFGAGTEAAVRSYQRAHGLADDGIVGTDTYGVLIGG